MKGSAILRSPPAWIGVLVAVCAFWAVVLWASGEWPAGRSGPVRIGVNHSPPWSTIGPDGVAHGFTVEVLNAAAKRRGIELQWVTEKAGPDSALASGNVNVWSLVTDVPRRHGHMYFTDPYIRTRFGLLTRGGSGINQLADAAGHSIAHADNSNVATLTSHFFGHSLLIPTDPAEEIAAVCRGRADAAFLEMKTMLGALLARPAECRSAVFDVLSVDEAAYDMAIGSDWASQRVAKSLRNGITELSRDGSLNEIYRRWLRDTSDETRIVNDLMEARERSRLLGWGLVLLGGVVALLALLMYRKRLARKAIQSAYEFASVALDGAGGVVVICNRRCEILRLNRACERASGKSIEEVRGKPAWEVFVPDDERVPVQSFYARLAAGIGEASHEHHWETLEGRRLFSWSNTTLKNQNGKVDYIIATGIDITAREEVEDRLSFEATHDPLTNLANRRSLMRQLEAAAAEAPEVRQEIGIALADLDRFKSINDTYGHAAGDAVLVRLAKIIREELTPRDLGARLGGDEFCLLLRGPLPKKKIERIRTRFAEEIFLSVEGTTFQAGVTFGLTQWASEADQPADLLRRADEALYATKRARPLLHSPPLQPPPLQSNASQSSAAFASSRH